MKKRSFVKTMLVTMVSIFMFVGIPAFATDYYNNCDVITVNFYPVSIELRSDGAVVAEYNNNSWSYCNDITGEYEFCPSEMGDWSYTFDNKEDLQKCINTYTSIKCTGTY